MPVHTIILMCAIDDEALQAYQKELIADVAEVFGVRKTLIQNVAPHFTLKYSIYANDRQLEMLSHTLSRFCSTRKKTLVTVGGFSGFFPDVIFTQVQLSQPAKNIFRELMSTLLTFEWIPWHPFDNENIHFHATIAEQCAHCYEEIMQHIKGKEKRFQTSFGNITMMRQTGETDGIAFWETYRRFDFFG